jgi:nitrous oxidase accessory protein NosD
MLHTAKIALTASLLAGGVLGVAAPAHASAAIVVRPGQSIQAALDAAAPRATVSVEPGSYHESLTITKPVTLRALGQVLLQAPSGPVPVNACTLDPDSGGGSPGMCIVGRLVDPTQDASPVAAPVSDVHVTGFRISGFRLAGVEIYGARHVSVHDVLADANPGGGLFAGKVDGLRVTHVHADGNGTRGIDLQENVKRFLIRRSTAVGNNGEGIFVGDSSHGVIAGNYVAGNCTGIAVLDEGQPGDSGVRYLIIKRNRVIANNRFCAGDEGTPSQSGNGIVLVGARHTIVTHNAILANQGSTDPSTGAGARFSLGGLALLSAAPITGGSAPAHDVVVHNVALDNAPADVLYDGSGTANTVHSNDCVRC